MKTDEIRQSFLNFFESKGHTIIKSDSVVPKDDPTVLFTTAGMQQFKQQFLGNITGYTRAASSQKCLRTDDLDVVGQTDFHHTFFEMLGNFSFGDYFKKEAILWAWEFLTGTLKINQNNLWVSVYKDDDEAEEVWLNDVGIKPEKLVKLGDKDNFWPANAKEKGPNGPCGPCSEIFFDYGENPDCTSKICDPSCDCGRFSEVWNLVFTQFNRKESGVLEPLPNKNIDTGMGLERLAAVMQGVHSNFDIDIFQPVIKVIRNHNKDLDQEKQRVIADHLRAIVFGIADGVVPSNEGRGYVIKKLIIDITDIGLNTGKDRPILHKYIPTVIEVMSHAYPELNEKQDNITDTVRGIETSYIRLRKEKLPEYEAKAGAILESSDSESTKAKKIGELTFTYKDTHGLTKTTMLNSLTKMGVEDRICLQSGETFEELLNRQQERSRAASKMTGDVFTDVDLKLDVPKTEFLGYTEEQSKAHVLKIFIENRFVNEAGEGAAVKVVLDKTPFYAEAGGQIGDTGTLTTSNARVHVKDTQKISDVYLHIGTIEKGTLRVGDTVDAKIDASRRHAIMLNHTATHLLQAALRETLGTHVKQQGSLVAEDRLRFDFTHPKPVTPEETEKIENRVKEIVKSDIPVTVETLKLEEAKKKGALAFFGEKYGEDVRVVSVGDISKEFCGGTHIDHTGEIKHFVITSQGSVAQGIRRVEARTGEEAADFEKEKQAQKAEHEKKIELKARQKDLEKERFKEIKDTVPEDLKQSPVIKGTVVFSKVLDDLNVNNLKKIADLVKQKAKSSVVVLGSQNRENATIIVSVSDDVVAKGLKANELINDIAPLINGKGGGRPQMAQAGSKSAEKIDAAVGEALKIIEKKL